MHHRLSGTLTSPISQPQLQVLDRRTTSPLLAPMPATFSYLTRRRISNLNRVFLTVPLAAHHLHYRFYSTNSTLLPGWHMALCDQSWRAQIETWPRQGCSNQSVRRAWLKVKLNSPSRSGIPFPISPLSIRRLHQRLPLT